MTTLAITKQPTYRVGPRNGIKVEGTVRTDDLQVNDDAIIAGDLEVTGTIYATTLSAGVTVATDHLTAPLTVDAASHITAAAGESNIDYALSTGTITTPSGANTLSGHVAVASGKNLVMAGAGAFTTGTGAVAINGAVTIAATKGITKTAGAGNFDFSAGTGTFLTSTGANTLSGDVEIATGKTFTQTGTGTFATGTGAVGINGAITIAKSKDLTLGVGGGQGTGKFEWLSTGIFTTSSGANTLSGDVTISGTKTFTTGTGAVALNGDVAIAANKNLVMGTAGSGTGIIQTGTGAISLNGTTTIATGKVLAVTDADALTVGGVMVPQYTILNVPINASSVDQWVFIADAGYELVSIETVFTVTSTSGVMDLYKSSAVQAPASGATMLTGTISIAGTANTPVAGTRHGTAGNRSLADGNKMGLVFTGTMTGLVGGVVTIKLARIA